MSRRRCILCCESKFVFSHIIITTNLTLTTEKRPAPALVDQPLQPFHHKTPARIGKVQSVPSFLCIDKSPVIPSWQWAFRFRHALYVVDQSQRTVPSDQSQQRGLTVRRGLERLILRNASHESFTNHLEMMSN